MARAPACTYAGLRGFFSLGAGEGPGPEPGAAAAQGASPSLASSPTKPGQRPLQPRGLGGWREWILRQSTRAGSGAVMTG